MNKELTRYYNICYWCGNQFSTKDKLNHYCGCKKKKVIPGTRKDKIKGK